MYYSTEDEPSTAGDLGFPETPFLGGPNPDGEKVLFDSSDIRISPNRNTLHHDLQVFAGFLMGDESKPYTIVNVGDGVFEARGQTVNFTAPSLEELKPRLGPLASTRPVTELAGGKWRAVATEQIKIDLSGDAPFDYEWAATRVDFYTRGDGQPEHKLTLIYALWADLDSAETSVLRAKAEDKASDLIESGPLNLGGQ